MKRILVLALVFLMLFSVSALGEEIDFSAMSLDELVGLRNSITVEINQRIGDYTADTMYQGDYTVGVDITTGVYLLTAITQDAPFSIRLYENANRETIIINEHILIGNTYYLELKDGMLLDVYNGAATITPSTKPSWAP